MGTMMLKDKVLRLLTDSLLNCTDGPIGVPNAKEFLSNLSVSLTIGLVIATVITLATVALAIVHFRFIICYVTPRYRRAFIIFLAGTAPFVSVFSLIAMYMPRVWFLAHLLSFFYFSIALWVIICLLRNIFEGRQEMLKKMKSEGSQISVQTPPFCCFFPCLPKIELEHERIRFCELMVFQAPCVRLFFTILSLILFFEFQDSPFVALKLLDMTSLPSLLIGLYGTHILVTTASKLNELLPYRYIAVFRILDCYFGIFGIQHPVFDFLARVGVFGCGELLPAVEYAYFWKNLVVIFESFLVSLIASVLLKPSRSALFDKYPSCRSVASSSATHESSA